MLNLVANVVVVLRVANHRLKLVFSVVVELSRLLNLRIKLLVVRADLLNLRLESLKHLVASWVAVVALVELVVIVVNRFLRGRTVCRVSRD